MEAISVANVREMPPGTPQALAELQTFVSKAEGEIEGA